MNFDITIIGAGPSGSLLACALEKLNLKVALIEKNKFLKSKNDGREIALTHASITILKKIGIFRFISSKLISPIKQARVLDGNSPYYLLFDHKNTVKNELGYLISNKIIKKAVFDKLKKTKNIKLFMGSEVAKITINKNFSKVCLKGGATIKSSLTVISDGRLSKNREKLGIHANITNFGTSMTVFRMNHTLSNNNIASEYFNNSETIAVLPLKKNLSSIVITLPNKESKKFLRLNKREINKKIETDLKEKFGKMNLIGKKYTYPMITVYSDDFFRDRCVLIGDSALGMHPVTAHGFNLNLKGINILQNEILTAVKNQGDIGAKNVLKNYESKFKKTSLPIYLATNAIVRLYTNQKKIAKIARKSLLHIANRVWPIKNAIIDNLLIKN